MTRILRLIPKSAAVCLCLFLLCGGLCAQSGAAQPGTQAPATKNEDRTGMYTFLQEGEFVQLTLETAEAKANKPIPVSGFVSRYGDDESDKGAFLDHFFSAGSLTGDRISFTTKTVHGVWFDFAGKIARGPGKTRADEGYYMVQGTLTRNKIDVNKKTSAQKREVSFKSFPDLDAIDAQPKN